MINHSFHWLHQKWLLVKLFSFPGFESEATAKVRGKNEMSFHFLLLSQNLRNGDEFCTAARKQKVFHVMSGIRNVLGDWHCIATSLPLHFLTNTGQLWTDCLLWLSSVVIFCFDQWHIASSVTHSWFPLWKSTDQDLVKSVLSPWSAFWRLHNYLHQHSSQQWSTVFTDFGLL